MNEHFTPIADTDALDALFGSSADHPVILFKHDPYCSISARAHREMEQVADAVAIVDVSADRAVSGAVAERTGVRHESPQVIVLRNGAAAWSASHFRITADAVARALREESVAR